MVKSKAENGSKKRHMGLYFIAENGYSSMQTSGQNANDFANLYQHSAEMQFINLPCFYGTSCTIFLTSPTI